VTPALRSISTVHYPERKCRNVARKRAAQALPVMHHLLMQTLTNEQRDALMNDFWRDGYAVLPFALDPELHQSSLDAIDRIAAQQRADGVGRSIKIDNCVDADDAFLQLAMWTPALQLAYDCFGPMFHLNQSNLISRPREETTTANFVNSSPWHSDGPMPYKFSRPDEPASLHYLKFGHFLTDLRHGTGGSLQIIRGSHRKPAPQNFNLEEHRADFIQLDCTPGTVVMFHQAQWHAAPPNESEIERKNLYISYCPTWLRPFDREFPDAESIAHRTPEERFLLGEPRPAKRWWLPTEEDRHRMSRYARA
jgi:hypothetical protein